MQPLRSDGINTSFLKLLSTLRRHPRAASAAGVTFVCTLLAMGSAHGDDVVYLAPGEAGQSRTAVRGEIVDWTGEAITIRRSSGTERRIDTARIEQVDTVWPHAYELGRQAYAEHNFTTAERLLAEAARRETRPWARRQILHRLLLAQESSGNLAAASELVLSLVASDPAGPALNDAPLAWFPDAGLDRSTAEALLGRSQAPAAVLVGASHLLGTASRSKAERALSNLLGASDPRMVALAEAQLWRTKLLSVTAADALRWSRRINEMPSEVRAGAYFVIGEAWQRLGKDDQALLAYLRVPIHYPNRRALAARALVNAARISQQAGRTDEAARLLREVISEYPDRPERTEAQQMLETSD